MMFMSGKKDKKKKAEKPQYDMGSNVLYLFRLSREVPGLLLQRNCLVLVSVVISVTSLYMSSTLLHILEQHQSLEKFLGTLCAFALVLLTQVNPFLIGITLVTAGLGYLVSYHFVQKDYQFQEEASKPSRGGFWVFNATRSPKLAKNVRIFGMRDWLEGMYAKYRKLAEDVQKRRARNNIMADIISLALDFLRGAVAYAYLLFITLRGNLSAGEFLLYFTAVGGFTSWVTGILSGFTTLHRQSIEISMIREFCQFPEPFRMEGGRELTVDAQGVYELELRDVSYQYPTGKKPVLEHFNLKVRPGEKLAVMGVKGVVLPVPGRTLSGAE